MNRKTVLEEAIKCVCETRDQQYGSPQENFARIASLWNAYKPFDVSPHDAAVMMALLKVARIGGGQINDDNYVDGAGYLSLACEIATERANDVDGSDSAIEHLHFLTPEERAVLNAEVGRIRIK